MTSFTTSITNSTTKKKPVILIMAGGTGGHIFPGLAVADYMKSIGWAVHWLGTAERMEADIIPKMGYPITFIKISGLRNKGLSSLIKAPFKLCLSVINAIKVIKTVKPDVVLGMGGYASGPGGMAAWLMRKPLVLHEQNAAAGLTNRLLAKIANKVLCAFPHAFPRGISHQVVGNPLRADIIELAKNTACSVDRELKISKKILVVGGSLGAQILNETVPAAVALLKESNIEIRHQTGKGKLTGVQEKYKSLSVETENTIAQIKVTEFIDDMASAYQWADVVICRAGALTVSELAMAAKPAIFVPLPHAVDDHQTKNAQFLVAHKAARLLPQSTLTAESLAKELDQLFVSKEILTAMAKAAYKAACPDATIRVANTCMDFIKV
jgi:UDP-N-acetylglucosamine--N-acetylmuramyl-(pentapeptide) pyrophosphoryl-undecaprenol N-acetylglucosamine transferase